MKTIKIIFLVLIFSFVLTTVESFAYPRHRGRVSIVFPRYRPVEVVVVKRPVVVYKIHRRHPRRIVRYYY